MHFTSVTVGISIALRRMDQSHLPEEVRKAIDTRGESAVLKCLGWPEPPREVSFREGKDFPSYWGGSR
jgi:hypothetical protein